ncbi:hypothetical protein [Alicyclobacillus sp. ALC3]|uniref:hypothetical protein n=1 Tax=Alicyclobacillus sp. ALC3 TaxID=2796143 RepID=UPI002378E036|nr:hypothetical protein [Alicyclobacillus sp. ALC3]WDL98868.1 hypothetical protein JC200_09540 [Alicyclobacillus sp. ALC3]
MDGDSKCDDSMFSKNDRRSKFVREVVERLHDGCSVTFTVPHDVGTEVSNNVFQGLRERGCLTAHFDLMEINSIEEFAYVLTQTFLRLLSEDNGSSANNIEGVRDGLSESNVEEIIQDVFEMDDLERMNKWEKIDWAVGLAEGIGLKESKRLVVWFGNWQEITRIGGDHLTKRLRALYQLHSHVTYAFTGTHPALMRSLFANSRLPFYRSAVELQYPDS